MSLRMSREEREAFLADVHVGIISIAEEGRGPLAVPIWYDFTPDRGLWLLTDPGSRKGELLATAGRFSLCAQSEEPPYRYVSVEGPILSTESADAERDLRPMARRYLGREGGDRYTDSQSPNGSVVVTMRPQRWLTVDYGKLGGL